MEQQKVNEVQNIDANPFFSNQQAVMHYPDKFLIDFRQITHQFTHQNQPAMVVNHKIILLDPYAAKSFLNTLKENIEKYEKDFGKIGEPESIKKAEKRMKKKGAQEKAKPQERPYYAG